MKTNSAKSFAEDLKGQPAPVTKERILLESWQRERKQLGEILQEFKDFSETSLKRLQRETFQDIEGLMRQRIHQYGRRLIWLSIALFTILLLAVYFGTGMTMRLGRAGLQAELRALESQRASLKEEVSQLIRENYDLRLAIRAVKSRDVVVQDGQMYARIKGTLPMGHLYGVYSGKNGSQWVMIHAKE